MKEFEKWDRKKYPLPATIERGPVSREMKAGRKAGWKAALEWVLSQQGQIDWRFNPAILPKTIEKELGVKNENNQN